MTATLSLLDRICDAQTRNSTLSGEDLRAAAQNLAALATRSRRILLAVDEPGERLIGAALMIDERLRAADTSRRLDGLSLLLVAGHIAGTTGISIKAGIARSLGASSVDAVVLGERALTIDGCDEIGVLALSPHLIAL